MSRFVAHDARGWHCNGRASLASRYFYFQQSNTNRPYFFIDSDFEINTTACKTFKFRILIIIND